MSSNGPKPIKLIKRKLSEKTIKRFWKFVDKRGEDDCWLWKGGLTNYKYGLSCLGSAHRLSYAIHYKEPGKRCVLHSCDNSSCVNPKHLYTGDHQRTMRDKYKRPKLLKGLVKLSPEDVSDIIKYLKQRVRQADIADRFGVSQPNISYLRKRYILDDKYIVKLRKDSLNI